LEHLIYTGPGSEEAVYQGIPLLYMMAPHSVYLRPVLFLLTTDFFTQIFQDFHVLVVFVVWIVSVLESMVSGIHAIPIPGSHINMQSDQSLDDFQVSSHCCIHQSRHASIVYRVDITSKTN
tara:strand:- start:59 stop:421 length:363 start_codon:yes stop_codon:yes gene_type:complete